MGVAVGEREGHGNAMCVTCGPRHYLQSVPYSCFLFKYYYCTTSGQLKIANAQHFTCSCLQS